MHISKFFSTAPALAVYGNQAGEVPLTKLNSSMDATFANDVMEGLSANPKHLSSKYFYDEKGDALFRKIMEMDAYYLTRAEYNIFQTQKDAILKAFEYKGNVFNLIEFGAGDGYKTKVLLQHFLENKAKFKYSPIDISANVLNILETNMAGQFPGLEINGMQDDYFDALAQLDHKDQTRKVVLFLGSNIGNFTLEQSKQFLQRLAKNFKSNDVLFLGFDLKKDPQKILRAYNDEDGITKAFNLNVLERINNTFDGDIIVGNFMHYPTYNPLTGACKSYLVSKCEQEIYLEKLKYKTAFKAWEAIDVEVSQKFSLGDISNLAEDSGFQVEKNFFNDKNEYVNSLWSIKA